jgi:hypothetical protein
MLPVRVELFFPSFDSFMGYHSKNLYPLINDQYTLSVRMKLFVLPLVHSLKTYDSFLFIDDDQNRFMQH